MKRFCKFFLTLTILISCNQSSKDRFESEINKYNNRSVIGRDIPDNFKTYHAKKLKKNAMESLKLDLIENGFDLFQMRVWENFKDLTGRLIILKNVHNKWSSDLFQYKFTSTDGTNLDSISGIKIDIGTPKSGWRNFINHVFEMEVLTLPDESRVTGYFPDTDETSIEVEFATKKYYRVYNYLGAYEKRNKFSEAKKMVDIMDFIKKEFSLK